MQLSIVETARLTGTTSRTLRHYGDIGLLPASSVGANGMRYYDQAGLTRLQRILLLRDLGVGLQAIGEALANSQDDADALEIHLEWLHSERERLGRQIAAVRATVDSLREGSPLMAEEMLDGFDHTQYQEEVEQRWGKDAYARSDRWWKGLGPQGQQAFKAEAKAIGDGWAAARTAGEPVDGPTAQALAQRHIAWIAAGWGGVQPNADQILGLAEMYVADERFAANYGGVEGATYVHDALSSYVRTH